MARKLRIQFEGAVYHVINRGNYRHDVFSTAGAALSFEVALSEVSEEFGWRLHAYVIMRNHFHLAVETPHANLVQGMHWLTGTYANRFNRFRSEHGHLFQGRYQALLVEDSAALVRVVDYIHLNPVRAKLIDSVQLHLFRWSSLRRFPTLRRPPWLFANWLSQLGLDDSVVGWAGYRAHLVRLSADVAEQDQQLFGEMSSGWAIGSSGWRRAMAKDYALMAISAGLAGDALREINAARFAGALVIILKELGKNADDIRCDSKGAAWKVTAASSLRTRVNAPHAWIAEALNMGSAASLRSSLHRHRLKQQNTA